MIYLTESRAGTGTSTCYLLAVTGHANYAPFGGDIVCAAVSALYETLRNALRTRGELVFCRESDGRCSVCGRGAGAAVLFPAVWQSLAMLAEQYPTHVAVQHLPQTRAQNRA